MLWILDEKDRLFTSILYIICYYLTDKNNFFLVSHLKCIVTCLLLSISQLFINYYSLYMLLRIVSAEWELYRGEVQKALLPTEQGFLGIFPGHMNLVTPLVQGLITYVPLDAPVSTLDSFADHSHTIQIWWWLCTVEDEIITIAA